MNFVFARPLKGCLLALFVFLNGCAQQQLAPYASEQPTLKLSQFFNDAVLAHGIFQDRSGQVVRRFTVEMQGHWQGDQGELDEHFTYSDGRKERRVWHLTQLADGSYSGVADDVVGQASGHVAGNTFHWNYTLKLPVDDSVYEVQFDDWMYLVDDKLMLNRATMSKFGIRLGDVTLAFQKAP